MLAVINCKVSSWRPGSAAKATHARPADATRAEAREWFRLAETTKVATSTWLDQRAQGWEQERWLAGQRRKAVGQVLLLDQGLAHYCCWSAGEQYPLVQGLEQAQRAQMALSGPARIRRGIPWGLGLVQEREGGCS